MFGLYSILSKLWEFLTAPRLTATVDIMLLPISFAALERFAWTILLLTEGRASGGLGDSLSVRHRFDDRCCSATSSAHGGACKQDVSLLIRSEAHYISPGFRSVGCLDTLIKLETKATIRRLKLVILEPSQGAVRTAYYN